MSGLNAASGLIDFGIPLASFLCSFLVTKKVLDKYLPLKEQKERLFFSGTFFAIIEQDQSMSSLWLDLDWRTAIGMDSPKTRKFMILHYELPLNITVPDERGLYNTIVCFFPPEDIANLPSSLMQKVIPLLSDEMVAAVMASKLS